VLPRDSIGVGFVSHTRGGIGAHAFRHSICMLLVDLATLPALVRLSRWLAVERPGILSIESRHWLADVPGATLRERIVAALAARGCEGPTGRVLLLEQPASFNVAFNPVRFVLCLDRAGNAIEYVLAEINNTPWNERHVYVLRAEVPARQVEFDCGKEFHVSPFNAMAQRYRWQFELTETRLRIAMCVREDDSDVMRAALNLRLVPLTARAVRRCAVRFPLQPLVTLVRIYWHAARLYLRGARFYEHPKWRTEP
jgi:DUF1365 family protein